LREPFQALFVSFSTWLQTGILQPEIVPPNS
jgi:hypothetical protein